jgi:hypothetical protein
MIGLLEMLSGKNINFLIGSGASMPLYPTLSLGYGLPSFEDFVCSRELSLHNIKWLYCYYYKKWISGMHLSKLNVADPKYKQVIESYKTFIGLVLGILDKESNEKPKRANIFTTNYDLLFESTFDEISKENPLCYFNDGSRGFINRTLDTDNFYLNVSHSGYHDNYRREVPTINLFKMHGSVSWKKSDDRIIVSCKDYFHHDMDDIIESINNFHVESIDQIFANFDTHKDLSILATELENSLNSLSLDNSQVNSFYQEYEKLPIINPNKWKFHDTVFDQHYYQLIRSFSYEIEKENTILIIFAFSFADEHILEIFKRSMLNPKLQVIIVSYSEKSQNELKCKFSGFKNITYYPPSFEKEDGSPINGDFEYLNNILRGQ